MSGRARSKGSVSSEAARRAVTRLASLIGTCKLKGVEPFAYTKATLEAIAVGYPQSRIDRVPVPFLQSVPQKWPLNYWKH